MRSLFPLGTHWVDLWAASCIRGLCIQLLLRLSRSVGMEVMQWEGYSSWFLYCRSANLFKFDDAAYVKRRASITDATGITLDVGRVVHSS